MFNCDTDSHAGPCRPGLAFIQRQTLLLLAAAALSAGSARAAEDGNTAAPPAASEPATSVQAAAAPSAHSAPASGGEEDSDQGGDALPPTLFTSVDHVGGYGGPSVMYSRVAGSGGVLVGAEGAVLLDHRLAFGGGGYGWTRDMRGPADTDGVPRDLRLGYGGLLVRYSVLTGSLLYGTAGVLVGGGGIALDRDMMGRDDFEDGRPAAADAFFVCEPQLSLQINLVRWMRVGLQAGYRLTSGLGRLGYDEADINGVTLGGTLQFGRL